VIANNQKLYVNREDGFIGWGLKKDEFIADCSELDDVIAIRRDGKVKVSRINEKVFMGKDILHVGIWKKGDERMVYNLIYSDGKSGKTFAKRFSMPAIIRDKEYNLDQGNPNSKVHYLSANPNGEAEVVEVKLSQASTARKKIFDFDFSELEIKGRGARGNTVTHYPVRKVDFKESRGSTLSGLELWFDEASGRLNKDKRGWHVGKFDGEDQILSITKSGNYKVTNFELTNRYEPENKTLLMEKFNPKKVISAVYWDGESKQHFVKRFQIETNSLDKEFNFITEGIGSRLEFVTTSDNPEIEIEVVKGKGKDKESEVVNLEDLIDVKGWKALGNRLSQYKVTKVKPVEDPEETGLEEGDDTEMTEATSSPSSKKKISQSEIDEGEQASLFGEDPQEQVLVNGQPPKSKSPRPKAEQADLFGKSEESGDEEESEEGTSNAEESKEEEPKIKKDDEGFSPGQTIELDL
jgi:topoisomerase-4 subunit A